MWLEGVDRSELRRVDSHTSPTNLAGALLELLFTQRELASGNATKPRLEGISMLDSERMSAIRGEYTFLL